MYKIFIPAIFFIIFLIAFSSCKNDTVIKEAEKEKPKTEQTPKVNTDEIVAKIQKYRADNEVKVTNNSFTKKIIPLTGANVKENIKQKWSELGVFSEGDKIIRLMLYPHKGATERSEEFYLQNGKLVFVFIQNIEKHEGKDTGEPGLEIYFDNDKLIKMNDTSGEIVKNIEEEKKMYESRMPYEVNELLEIIKTTK